ncbi:MAG: SCP2 sterol-binding domain-containing protein [Deltaproteobacteria bacterium]|nr:SCP2 sterol-binding domain-containing protein [Deltaproteobacteria bacterium]
MGIDDTEKNLKSEAVRRERSEEATGKAAPASARPSDDEDEVVARPSRTPDADLEAEASESGADESEDDARAFREPAERRRNFANARELMTEELRTRATQSSDRLRACLTGSIIVKLKERGEKYLFDWTGGAPRAEATDQAEGDCVINLSEGNLLKIAAGELNPQIGMLSEKIQVQGKLSLAVYFFNLIAPFPQH